MTYTGYKDNKHNHRDAINPRTTLPVLNKYGKRLFDQTAEYIETHGGWDSVDALWAMLLDHYTKAQEAEEDRYLEGQRRYRAGGSGYYRQGYGRRPKGSVKGSLQLMMVEFIESEKLTTWRRTMDQLRKQYKKSAGTIGTP